jgi:deazaflavin-dependent oxidoreductase (nitroreductase family)
MGLSSELGYQSRAQNSFQHQVVRFASTKPVSSVMRKLLPPIDRVSLRVTGGKMTLTSSVSGLPVVWLTTTGGRSGARRTVPLLAFPIADDLALLGTSFGQAKTPGWVYNIEKDPTVTIAYRGSTVPGRARPARADEEPGIWERAGSVYPGYLSYGERAAHRRIRVFVLESMPIG